MTKYRVYFDADRWIEVKAEGLYCSGSIVCFFINNEKGVQTTVAIFSLNSISGFRMIEEENENK